MFCGSFAKEESQTSSIGNYETNFDKENQKRQDKKNDTKNIQKSALIM